MKRNVIPQFVPEHVRRDNYRLASLRRIVSEKPRGELHRYLQRKSRIELLQRELSGKPV